MFTYFLTTAYERQRFPYPQRRKDPTQVAVARYVAQRTKLQGAKYLGEASTMAEVRGLLKKGEVVKTLDLLSARFMAVEEAAKDGNWTKAGEWEVRANVTKTLAGK